MPTLIADKTHADDLSHALGAAGETEYRRMVRVSRMGRGRFHLFPVESDFGPTLRATLLDRLRDDLAVNGLRLRVLTLTRDCWDIVALLESQHPIQCDEVVVLGGLDDTPNLVAEPGAKPQRPRTLAVLNQMRETLRQSIPAPFFLWCSPYAYTIALEHAPDFFDQYTGKFRFSNANPTLFAERDSDFLNANNMKRFLFAAGPLPGSQAAVDYWRKQVEVHNGSLLDQLSPLISLLNVVMYLPEFDRSSEFLEAIDLMEIYLRVMARKRNWIDRFAWALGKSVLGVAYANFPNDNRNMNLRKAIACYSAALRVCTESAHPTEWAAIQIRLGEAYSKLRNKDWSANLYRAIVCYEAASRFYTEAEHPQEWAVIQQQLGEAYFNLKSGDRYVNLQNATSCFLAALRVYSEINDPKRWAFVQVALGTVSLLIHNKEMSADLRACVACFEAALRFYTEENYHDEWTTAQFGLAIALERCGDLSQAKVAYERAMRGYRSTGDMKYAQKAEVQLKKLSDTSH